MPAINPDAPDTLPLLRTAPLTFGTWGDLKRLYKDLEADPDPSPARRDALAALIARLDCAPLIYDRETPSVELGDRQWVGGGAVQNGRGIFAVNMAVRTADFNGQVDRLRPQAGKPLDLERQGGQTQIVWAGPTGAAVFSADDKIQMIDVSDFANPRWRGSVGGKKLGLIVNNPLSNLASIAGGDGVVYAVCNHKTNDGFHVISLADPDAPQIVGSLPLAGASRVVTLPGGSLVAVLATGPVTPNLVGSFLARVGVKVPSGEVRQLYIIDVSQPDAPRIVSALPLDHDNQMTASDDGLLYVVGKRDTGNRYDPARLFFAVSVADPAAPRLVGQTAMTIPYGVGAMVAYKGIVYVAPQYGRIQVVDARDPRAPKVGRELTVSYANQMICDGETMYLIAQSRLYLLHLGAEGTATPSAYGTPPSPQTLGYMKRRARRYLTTLAQKSPDQFVALATRYFAEPGDGGKFDPAYQWVALDLLFGAGGRFVQSSHGRGAFRQTRPRPLALRRGEERFADLWHSRPDDAATLFAAPFTVWPARELALRVLRANRAAVPALSDAALPSLLDSPSITLIAEGVRQTVARAEAGEAVGPALAARALLRSSSAPRRRLIAALAPLAKNDAAWGGEFAAQLMPFLSGTVASRRADFVAGVLAHIFPDLLTGDTLLGLAPRLLRGAPALYAPVIEAARREGATRLGNWLVVLALVNSPAATEDVLAALAQSVAGVALDPGFYTRLLRVPLPESAWAWRLIAASAVRPDALRQLWTGLLADPNFTPALQAAMQSPDALQLLGQAGISDDEMAGYLSARPEIVDLLTPDAFARLSQTLPAPLILRLAAAASPPVWEKLREGWLRNLREGVGLRDLWANAEDALKSDATGNLEARLLDDADVAETLLAVDDAEAILAIREPSFAPLLGRYFARHEETIAASDTLFLLAATHPLPDVRTPALALLTRRAIGLPFALGLLESEVPASAGAGRAWFDASDLPLLDRALALCDSPAASVRATGREFATVHQADLPLADFAHALTEHSDPLMQSFVARLLGNDPAPQFDREILRTRYQSRQAKETVKARQEAQTGAGQVDTATLLALARGSSTPRDSEWALTQLVRRALAGEAIDGLTIDGAVAGAKE